MENKQPMSLGLKIVISYVICLVLAVVLFVCCAVIRILIGMSNPESTFRNIVAVLQYVLPILLVLFGWLPPLLFKNKKDKVN